MGIIGSRWEYWLVPTKSGISEVSISRQHQLIVSAIKETVPLYRYWEIAFLHLFMKSYSRFIWKNMSGNLVDHTNLQI